jgi:TRAP-type C4-dicarboxylate transport system permease small subunit
MAVICFINVLSRFIFHFSFAFTEEVGINFFVWVTVLGSGIAFEKGAQLGMSVLYNIFPPTMKKIVTILSSLLSAFLFVAVDYYLIITIYREMTVYHSTSSALVIPMWIYFAGVPILSIFLFKRIYRGARITLKKIDEEKGAK